MKKPHIPREIKTGKRPRGRKHLNKTTGMEKAELNRGSVADAGPQFDQRIQSDGVLGQDAPMLGQELFDDIDNSFES